MTAVRATGFLQEVPVYAWINTSQVSQTFESSSDVTASELEIL